MSAPVKESTAVVERKSGIGTLPPEIQQQIELRRMANQVATEIAGMSWGQSIGKDTARALAEWGRRFNVDVTQEIDILGARVYLNSRYYLRRLSELVAAGLVDYAYSDHVNADDRLATMGERGVAELERRAFERAKYNVPEKAIGAVVFRVKMRALSQETVGVNWTGGGTRTKDPVGDAEPQKTAESRAARRCLRLLVSHVPAMTDEIERVVDALPELEARIHADHDSVKPALPSPAVHSGGYDEPTGPRKVETETIHLADMKKPSGPLPPDPYDPGDARE